MKYHKFSLIQSYEPNLNPIFIEIAQESSRSSNLNHKDPMSFNILES